MGGGPGGGAIRAAAKAAGLGLQKAGVRGGLPENIASVRKAIRQSASALSSTASVDDSSRVEFTAVSQIAPRLVFGPAPSLEETKEATSELRDALDKMYFSPSDSAENWKSLSAVGDHSLASKSDTKNCAVDQTVVAPVVSNNALKAFKLLKECPAAQTVVASLAADPKVWDAVLQNDALNEYLQSQKQSMECKEQNPLGSCEATLVIQDAGNSENIFTKAYKNVKLAAYKSVKLAAYNVKLAAYNVKRAACNVKLVVAGSMNSLSGYFQDYFGPDDKVESEAASSSLNSTTATTTLLGLAVMVIIVVIAKRG